MSVRQKTFLITTVSLLILISAPFLGRDIIHPGLLFGAAGDPITRDILLRIRLPRTLLGALSGASLALGGLAFQAIFRNPLATPFTLGVSSGAAFGATLVIYLGAAALSFIVALQVFGALGGALISIFLVYFFTRSRGGFSTHTMLLAGVAVNFFFSSLILLIQYMTDIEGSFRIIRWLMGGIETVGYESSLFLAPWVVIGAGLILWKSRELDLVILGEDIAVSRGVDVERLKKIVFFAVSVMTAAVVAKCGPIGFVGMMVPHICRLIVGAEHVRLAPVTCLFGGAFLCLCDVFARTVAYPAEIPLGVITALLGGPFFLWLLLENRRAMSYL